MLIDLTRREWLRRIIRNPLFPAVIQWSALAALVLLVVIGWNYHGIRGVELPDPLVYTSLTTLAFWVVWLMGLIFLVPLIGRLWCTVCPLGYINDILGRFAPRLRWPAALRNHSPAALLLVFYNVLVTVVAVNHYPDYTARLILGILAFLVLVGFLFKGRVFCGHLCPIGTMVGVYSRVAPWRLGVRDRQVCRDCSSKACFLGEEKGYLWSTPLFRATIPLKRPGCQVDLFPPEMEEETRCVMCTQCVKNCPYDNVSWGTRPFLGGLVRPGIPNLSEAFFIAFLLGTVTSMFLRVWPALNRSVTAPGRALASALFPPGSSSGETVSLLWLYALLPLLILGGLSLLTWFLANSSLRAREETAAEAPRFSLSFGISSREERAARETEGWMGRRLRPSGILSTFSLAFVPLVLSAHVAAALVKLNEKISYLQGTLWDPTGVKFYLAIHKIGRMTAPSAVLPLWLVRWIAAGLVVLGLAVSLYALAVISGKIYADAPAVRDRGRAVFSVGLLAVGSAFLTMVVKWLF